MSDNTQPAYARPARLITVLGISPAIGLGICRFAHALVLPGMRESLEWSWPMAGLMNTVNSAGYLVGAYAASIVACMIHTITRRDRTPRTKPLRDGRSA